jgi:glycosyltransferase 2 family protein
LIGSKWRKILYTTGIVLGLGLLAQQAWQGFTALQSAQTCVAQPVYLLGMLAAYIAAYFVQMAAWALIMRALRAPLAPQAVLEGYALAFLPRYIPGSVWGYLSRGEWLAQRHGVGYGVSTTASLLEAAMLVATATLVGALFWLPTLWQGPLLPVGIVVAGALALWLLWQVMPWLARRFTNKSGEMLPAPRPSWRLFGATTLLYLAFWALQGIALVAIAHALCGGMALAPFPTIAAAALAWAIGFLILFVPAGLGVREWTLSALLVAFTAIDPAIDPGIDPGQATLLAVVSRFGLIVAELIVLAIGLHAQILHRWQRRKWLSPTTNRN